MFGKTKDHIDTMDEDGIFGDEVAADHDAQIDAVRERVRMVEGQISSQFTSMAAYAQIAQEQIELTRAESRSITERAESRLIELIERERGDRMQTTGDLPGTAGTPADVDARLTALEEAVEVIKVGISDCLSRQKSLADAITALFDPHSAQGSSPLSTLPPPAMDGPIGGLAMHG